MADVREMLAWRGREVVDVDGDRVGRLEEIYLDADTDEAHWAAVKTGLVGGRLSLVPLAEATERADYVVVPFDKRTVKDAPNVDSGAELTPEEESTLHRYYGSQESSRDDGAPEHPERRDSRDETASRSETDSSGGSDSRGGGRGRVLGRALGAAARNVGQAAMQEARSRGSSAESDRGRHAGDLGRGEGPGRGGPADERSPEAERPPHTADSEPERRADERGAGTGQGHPHAEDHGPNSRNAAQGSTQPAPQAQEPTQTGEAPHTADEGRPRAEEHPQRADAEQPGESAGGERPRGRLRRHVTTEYLSDTGEVERRETHTEEERPQ